MSIFDMTPDVAIAKFASVAGALVSMRFLNGTWGEKVFTAICGVVLSYFLTPWLSTLLGLPEGVTGFLLGLFGMAIASRLWEWIQLTPLGALWQITLDWLPRRKPKEPK